MTTPNVKQVRTYAADAMAFFADLQVRGARGLVRLGDVMAPHQREWLDALAPGLRAMAAGERPPIGKFFWEGTKGSGKDFCLALGVLWLVAFTKRPIFAQIGAADRDQADEMRKSAKSVLRYNRWLAGRIVVQSWRIVCDKTDSQAEIIAADVAGSHGARPDVLILNELHAIEKWEFAENLLDNASKVPLGLVIIATNAGFTGTNAFRWREMARMSNRWSFHQFTQPAPWLDAAEIEEARLRNSGERYARLFWGQWSSGAGDALDPDDIAAAVTLDGPFEARNGIEYRGWSFVCGVDIGIKHDRSAAVVLGVKHGEQRIRLAWCKSWQPPRRGHVDLAAVEREIIEQNQQFHFQRLLYDPHQAQHMSQRLRRRGIVCEEVPFIGANLDRMATTAMEIFRSRVIDLYAAPPHGEQLIRDLGRLTIEEKAYGQRLTAVADANGHADLATALVIALPFAQKLSFGSYMPRADECHSFRASASRGRRSVLGIQTREQNYSSRRRHPSVLY